MNARAKERAAVAEVTNLPAMTPAKAGEIMEAVVAKGDIAALTSEERAKFYVRLCEGLGLNPMTRPFEYITLNGKLTLYARKDATDQLRKIYGVSVTDLAESERDGVFMVTAKVRDREGREDASKGAVALGSLKGEALANALMKAETKAKRRATLSICGLGFLDETEVADIADHAKAAPPKHESRLVLERMIGEAENHATSNELTAWMADHLAQIDELPTSQKTELRMVCSRRLGELRAKEDKAAHDVVEKASPEWSNQEVDPEAPDPEPITEAAQWSTLTPTKQAGILCSDASFHRFLAETRGCTIETPDSAAQLVRQHCLVTSRKDIRNNHPSGKLWRDLVAEYRAWQHRPAETDPLDEILPPLPSPRPPAPPQPAAERSDAPSASTSEAGAPDRVPSADEYERRWDGIIQAATNARQLGETWANQAEQRKQIHWPDDGTLNRIVGKVKRAIDFLKEDVR